MAWRCFQKVLVGEIRAREPKEVVHLVSKLTTPQHFLEYAAPKFFNFVMHNHVARCQDLQYKVSLEMLKEGEVLLLMSSLKITLSSTKMKYKNNIGSIFNYLSWCIYITYQVNLSWDPLDLDSLWLNIKYHYYLSNDRKHDNQFV
jgi:hypothetical protein